MQRVETSIVIRRPVPEVFAYLAAPEKLAEWVVPIEKSGPVSQGEIEVGFVSERETRGRISRHEVIMYELDHIIVMKTQSGPLEITEGLAVKPVEEGTRVWLSEEVVASGLLKPIEWIFAWMVGRHLDSHAQKLKMRLENEPDRG